MRLRAIMTDPHYVKKLADILQALSSLAKVCILRVCPDKFYFIIMESQQPQAWWELDSRQFFSEYSMNGVSHAQNEFYLEFGPEMLAETLVSLKKSNSPRSLKIKLAQKAGPCLTFEIELPAPVHLVRTCCHDFPVSIIPRSQWGSIHAAEDHLYDVSIEIPELREVRMWLECFKALGPYCYLNASRGGHFQAKVVHDLASCIKQFSGQAVVADSMRASEPDEDPQRLVSVRVDRRKLVAFLALEHNFPAEHVVRCDLAGRQLAHLQLVRSDAVLHFFCRHILEDVAARHRILDDAAAA